MREAVIVSTARTPIGRAFRGALNNIKSPTLMAHAIRHAVQRAGVDGAEIEDVVIGTVLTAGTAGMNLARNAAFAAGIPVTAGAQTIDRQCASGLTAIAAAAKQIVVDGAEIVVAGGQDNISAVQKRYLEWVAAEKDPNVTRQVEHAYMPMLLTAENVARKYKISRAAQDALRALVAAAHRARPGRGTLRRRDRPDHRDDGRRRQGDERSLVQGSDAREGRRQPARHDGREPRSARAGDRRRNGDRRQCEPALRRRVRLRADGGEARAAARSRAARPLPRHDGRRQCAGGDGHRSDLRGAEAPASCMALPSTTSACGS